MRKLIDWQNAYILLPRWTLSVVYLLYALLGLISCIRLSPTLSETSPQWWIPVWVVSITLSSIGCLMASLRPRWEIAEKWFSIILVACFAAFPVSAIYLFIQGDVGRASFMVLLVIAGVYPSSRMVTLIRRSGARR